MYNRRWGVIFAVAWLVVIIALILFDKKTNNIMASFPTLVLLMAVFDWWNELLKDISLEKEYNILFKDMQKMMKAVDGDSLDDQKNDARELRKKFDDIRTEIKERGMNNYFEKVMIACSDPDISTTALALVEIANLPRRRDGVILYNYEKQGWIKGVYEGEKPDSVYVYRSTRCAKEFLKKMGII